MSESEALLASPAAAIVAGLFGAVWGSFFNVCISRIPHQQSIVRPGSRCDACGAAIRAIDNIPVLSYFILRGRCRSCRAPFSAAHPVVEVMAALLAAGLWLTLVRGDPDQALAIRLARFAVYFAFGGVLLVLSVIDLRTRLLPDVLTLPSIPILYLAAFGTHDADWLERLIGAVVGYVFLRLIADFYYYKLKREGLGLGDAKLLALIGAVLGWRALPFVMFVGSFAGVAVSLPVALALRLRGSTPESSPLRHAQIPFGPFLAASAMLYVFAGPRLLARLFGL